MTTRTERAAQAPGGADAAPEPKTYSVLFAQDVPHYGTLDIEAAGDAAALAAARCVDLADVTHDPDWNYPVCRRIVHIEDPQGRMIATDVPLDGFHLGDGGDEARRLCTAAPELVRALREIAAIPLWGESIPPGLLRDDYAESAQYDLAEDSFEPCCDTESSQLRDAVETARVAVLALEGRSP